MPSAKRTYKLTYRPAIALAASLFLLGIPARALADQAADHESLARVLADTIDRGPLKSARVSIEVRTLDGEEVVFARRPDELLNPASNAKLFTAAAALVRLGPEYRFDTEFLTDQDIASGKIRSLYVRGKGDPSITTERLYGIVAELFHTGLREVAGDIVLDDGWFDAERTAPGFDQETSDRAYMAPTGAVSLNWNAVGVYLRPAERWGRKGTIEVDPPSDYFVVDGQVTTGSRRYRRFSVSSIPQGDRQRILVRGAVPADQGVFSVWKKIDNPPIYFGQTFKQMLADRGIKVKGHVRLGKVPDGARLIHVSQSETFDLVLKRMNKISSNFVAEQLIKTLGAEVYGPPGTFAKGISAVEDFLEKDVGIARGSYVMKNGSGLNDTNRFSTAQVNRLLKYMYDRFPLAPEYLSSMGIAGKDGTLRYRFEGSDAVGRLRGKTGTLENVSALSGYVQSVGGEKFIFSTIVNDYQGRAAPIIQGIDALGVAVAAFGSVRGPGRAVADLIAASSTVSPLEEAKSRIKTYLALGKAADQRNVPFLRTSWRSEKDPAVRAVVADAIYRSNPQDYLGARALLDSLLATEQTYGRLRQIAKEMAIEVPGLSSVIELAAEGNTEAVGRLVELAKASVGDEENERELAAGLSDVARTAAEELIHVLKGASAQDRDATTALLAKGLVHSADAEHPFWAVLRRSMGAVDPQLSSFAKQMDGALSLKIAQEKAPKTADEHPAASSSGPGPAQTAEAHPGG